MSEERTGRDFLESMSQCDELLDHEDGCGLCHHRVLDAEAAKEILASYPADVDIPLKEVVGKWCDLSTKKWQDSKYFKLWQEEKAAGRDPHKAFEERGWEP